MVETERRIVAVEKALDQAAKAIKEAEEQMLALRRAIGEPTIKTRDGKKPPPEDPGQ